MLKDKAVLEMPMRKLISNLFQMGLKNIFTLPFFSFQQALSLMAIAINIDPKKKAEVSQDSSPTTHPATEPQIWCWAICCSHLLEQGEFYRNGLFKQSSCNF